MPHPGVPLIARQTNRGVQRECVGRRGFSSRHNSKESTLPERPYAAAEEGGVVEESGNCALSSQAARHADSNVTRHH